MTRGVTYDGRFGRSALLAASLSWRRVLKRSFDVLASGILLAVFAPAFALLISVVRSDGGPAFYAQMRVGKGGRLFRCWKFRTMVVDAEARLQAVLDSDPKLRAEFDRYWKLQKDPRVTNVGTFLRRSSMDEIPQLLNVLRGDMSLIGPRPRSVAEVAQTRAIRPSDPYFSEVPGMTGLWQVSGRNKISLSDKIQLDAHYVENWSLRLDMYIVLRTFGAVWRGEGAT